MKYKLIESIAESCYFRKRLLNFDSTSCKNRVTFALAVISAFLFPVFLTVCSCTGLSCINSKSGPETHSTRKQSLRLVSWNAENFFDAVKDGTEYSEFNSSKSHWNRDAYIPRLDRLCEVIKKLDADVYILEEIENEGIMYDISNKLAGNAWNSSYNWNYACFAKNNGDATGCAVLSRFPLGAMTVHTLDVRISGEQPPMRPIIEVSVIPSDKPLVLFVNHWKSKSGGAAETEIWRNWQESVLAKLIADTNGSAAAACGDFNRDIKDFTLSAETGTAFLKYTSYGQTKVVAVVSPWIREDGTCVEPGSYYYKNQWERIDHIFTAGSAVATNFSPLANGPWTNDAGIPQRYKVFTGTGWSDHLPIEATITF
jgi:endonuclease/exonuclease/phosphatase family metal-dependent hydrolase